MNEEFYFCFPPSLSNIDLSTSENRLRRLDPFDY